MSKFPLKTLAIPIEPIKELRDTEKERVNPSYTNLLDFNGPLVPSVIYLWVLNSKHEIIIGIENPWRHPEAFGFDVSHPIDKELWRKIAAQLETTSDDPSAHTGFGHPTLAPAFTDSGIVNIGTAYLGGELRFEDDKWILNNRSGRYGRVREEDSDTIEQIQNTLMYVAHFFKQQGYAVLPKLFLKGPEKKLEILLTDETEDDAEFHYSLGF